MSSTETVIHSFHMGILTASEEAQTPVCARLRWGDRRTNTHRVASGSRGHRVLENRSHNDTKAVTTEQTTHKAGVHLTAPTSNPSISLAHVSVDGWDRLGSQGPEQNKTENQELANALQSPRANIAKIKRKQDFRKLESAQVEDCSHPPQAAEEVVTPVHRLSRRQDRE